MSIAYVLKVNHGLPDLEKVVELFRSRVPDGPAVSVEPQEGETAAILRLGERTVAVASMPAPVPNREADELAKYSLASWAGWELPPHGAHLVVFLQGEGTTPDVLGDFTRLVASLAEVSDAVGVYWGPGGVTHSSELFRETAFATELPVPIWLGFSRTATPEGRLDLLTLGLRQFDLPELRVTAPLKQGNDALGFALDIASYAIGRGAVVPDGETIGRSASEKLRVRHEPSPIEPDVNVWRVDLPEKRSLLARLFGR